MSLPTGPKFHNHVDSHKLSLLGRHPCLGMRFAKLEVKIILALFLTRYEYTLVDTQGRTVEKLPEPHRDNLCVYALFLVVLL